MSEDREFRIGIDVGGTNTDAVVIDAEGSVISAVKVATTPEPIDGIRESLSKVLQGTDRTRVAKAMLGTTHPTNAMSDRMKSSRAEIPLLAVGGGAHLIADRVPGISEVLRPRSYSVANAYGACIAEASGMVDRVYSYDRSSREECLDDAKELAANAAVRSGAHPDRIRITTVTEVPMTYVPGGGCRVMVKAVGPLA